MINQRIDGRLNEAHHERSRRLLTTAEVALILRTSPATVRYWRHIRTGPKSFKLGRRVVYRHTDLRSWLAEVKPPTTPEPQAEPNA